MCNRYKLQCRRKQNVLFIVKWNLEICVPYQQSLIFSFNLLSTAPSPTERSTGSHLVMKVNLQQVLHYALVPLLLLLVYTGSGDGMAVDFKKKLHHVSSSWQHPPTFPHSKPWGTAPSMSLQTRTRVLFVWLDTPCRWRTGQSRTNGIDCSPTFRRDRRFATSGAGIGQWLPLQARRRKVGVLRAEDKEWLEALQEMSGNSGLPMGPRKVDMQMAVCVFFLG